jgi:hypothetical protein
VLGLTGSGKRTLLQRLEGKDPFAATGPDGSNEQHDDDDDTRGITVPYQPPQNATVWDRIQLHVALKPSKDVTADFSVILINPRHDAKSLQPYISRLVSMLIQQRERNEPLCLCFLLNFRDLQGDRYARIQCDTVEKWAFEMVKHHHLNENQVILQCTTTSLKNCYGLSTLHHFIYRSYLVHKETELEERLSEVQRSLKETQEVPRMAYEAFLKVVTQKSKGTLSEKEGSNTEGSSHEQIHKIREKDLGKNNSNSVNDEKRTQALDSTRQQLSNDSRQKTRNEPESLRSILPKTYGDPKNLDAFFADDDDEEEGIVTPVTSHHSRDRILNSSDSDEDDDFFYDEGGHRHQHGTVVMDSLSDQGDEGSVESLDSQIAHARDHSVLDSEESGVDESEERHVAANMSAPAVEDRDTTIADASSESVSNKKEVVKDDNSWKERDKEENFKDRGSSDRQRMLEEAVGSDEADADGEGWDDNDDVGLDVDVEPEPREPSPREAYVSNDDTNDTSQELKNGPIDKERAGKIKLPSVQAESLTHEEKVPTKQQDSPSSEQATPVIASNDTGPKVDKSTEPSPTLVAKTPPSRAEQDESSDHGDFIVEETAHTPPTKPKDEDHVKAPVEKSPELSVNAKKPASSRPIQRQDESSDDDDDDDFVVETAAPSSNSLPTSQTSHPASPKVADKESAPEKPSSLPLSGAGISAAALAAIAAAEKEAARMMQDTSKEATLLPRKVEKKKSKKNKNPDAKKKKKKHKESSSKSS